MTDLFEHYPAAPGTVREQATALAHAGNAMSKVAGDAAKAATAASASVGGDLEAPVRSLGGPLSARGDELRGAAGFAGAAMTVWAAAVTAYNTTIDTLNREYTASAGNAFGVPRPALVVAPQGGGGPAPGGYDAAVRTARGLEVAALMRRRHAAEAVLDSAADDAAGMLDRGPNAIDWTTLQVAGALPADYLPYAGGGGSTPATLDQIEARLRAEGLLTGPDPGGYYRTWLQNAARRGVSVDTLVDIARTQGIRPDDFSVLDGLEEVKDPDGKSFFLLPAGISADDARKAVLMTFVLNAGTDYGTADGGHHDYPETPYSATEIQRVIDRQAANDWSYDEDVGFVNGNGGRLATTPNGMLMGLGGNWLQDKYSLNGGTTWGDIFMVNVDDPADADQALRDIVHSGTQGALDLDRLLHHEERHSEQWADKGYTGFIASYLASLAGVEEEHLWGIPYWVPVVRSGADNSFEQDAGLSDGGYR